MQVSQSNYAGLPADKHFTVCRLHALPDPINLAR